MSESHAIAHDPVVASTTDKSPLTLLEQPVAEAPQPAANLVPVAGWIAGEDSTFATRVSIIEAAGGKVIATGLVTLAERSSIFGRFGLPAASLGSSFVISDLAIDPARPDALPALFYTCLRRGRIWDRSVVATALAKGPESNGQTVKGSRPLDLSPLARLQPIEQGGTTWVPVAQRIDLAIHRAWTEASPAMHAFLREHFVSEAVEILDTWIGGRFFKTPFFQAIYDGTMTREQYICSLANMHQFVRWTTRLIGRAIGHSHDRAIRSKWIQHMEGEVNHEMIIEKDLAGLQADVDYVTTAMLPNVPTHQFMALQESVISFYNEPVLFMATPFVAEGFTARLDKRFIDSLRKVAKSWGVENPKQVTAFWASHIEYDGGDDGHWEHSRRMLDHYLRTDHDLQRFLNIERAACQAFERCYTSYIEDLSIFGTTPAARTA